MEVIAAAFQHHVGDSARGTAQFGFEIVGRDIHGLDGFGRRNQDLQQTGAFVIVDALDLVAVSLASLAVYFGLQGPAGVEELRVLPGGRRGSRHKIQQRLEIAVGAQRQIGHRNRVYGAAHIRAVGLQDRNASHHFDGFGHVAGLQLQIHAVGTVHRHVDSAPNLFLKPGHFHRNGVAAGRQVGKSEVTALIGLSGVADSRGFFHDGHFAVGDNSATGIGYRAEQSRVNGL